MTTDHLPHLTDDQMDAELATAREYALVILRATPTTFAEESQSVIWDHGRRNLALRSEGTLAIVCPVTDGSDVAGICIFDASLDEVGEIMAGDPAIEAGVLTYEGHPIRGFPGDRLPETRRRGAARSRSGPHSEHD